MINTSSAFWWYESVSLSVKINLDIFDIHLLLCSLLNNNLDLKIKKKDIHWNKSPQQHCIIIMYHSELIFMLTHIITHYTLMYEAEVKGQRSEVTLTLHSYPVGPAGRVKGVGSADEQRVVALLQQDLDEIMALVLERDEEWENHIISAEWNPTLVY